LLIDLSFEIIDQNRKNEKERNEAKNKMQYIPCAVHWILSRILVIFIIVNVLHAIVLVVIGDVRRPQRQIVA